MTGKTLGHYQVLEKLGAGGMGEVYRARDTRLNRDVALKVLPEVFAKDAERMARFEREAQVLASLNHPNIAVLYGVEESEGVRALAMELVEGPTLGERIAAGPIPVDEALPIAKQIADALEYAHDRGIVHRDLKPANVKVTLEGMVKVLDFGLAKALDDDPAASGGRNSPTLSLAATRAGVILGTAAYMSPEQAKGKPVDRRADIWAFGVVLAEMLSGKQLYTGETVAETLASVMKDEPALPEAPPHIHALLRRCLDRDLRHRLQAIGEARIVLEGTWEPLPDGRGSVKDVLPRHLGWVVGAAGLIAAGLSLWGWLSSPRPTPRPVMRWTTSLPSLSGRPYVTLSPDGSRLAYAGRGQVSIQVYIRQLDQIETKAIAGGNGAHSLFFSPDGQWIGYFSEGKLKKVPVTGGASITLCDAAVTQFGATWGPDDTIIFTGGSNGGLMRVPAAGGKPQVLASPDAKKSESGLYWPQFLPGGEAVLLTVDSGGSAEESRIAVLNLRTGERRTLAEGGAAARYVPTGHLVYGRGESLFAIPFDLARLRVTGSAVPVLEGIAQRASAGATEFSFSETGTLVYVPGGATAARTLAWVDRKGTASPLPAPPRDYSDVAISPDGQRVALEVRGPGNSDIWIYDMARRTLTRVTFQFNNHKPIWTPDGKRVTFRSTQPGKDGIFSAPADGSGPPEPVLIGGPELRPDSWTPDGKTLVVDVGPIGTRDIGFSPAPDNGSGERKLRPFLQGPYSEYLGALSPDGRWLAYTSSEAGRHQVFVQPFPGTSAGAGGKWQISTDGGAKPRWARNGRELFYRSRGGSQMLAVGITTSPTFRAGTPQPLFEWRYGSGGPFVLDYDVAPDGQRFLMLKSGEDADTSGQLQVIVDWFEELKRRAPARGR